MAMDTAQVHAKSRFFTDPTPSIASKLVPRSMLWGVGASGDPITVQGSKVDQPETGPGDRGSTFAG